MKKNKEMFNNIIGYTDVKMASKRIVDILNHQDKYKKLGCQMPNGSLIIWKYRNW